VVRATHSFEGDYIDSWKELFRQINLRNRLLELAKVAERGPNKYSSTQGRINLRGLVIPITTGPLR
jgi:hypothetical protein